MVSIEHNNVNKYNKLVQELALPEYTALSDQERYDSLILEDIPSTRVISTHDIQIYFEFIDVLYLIRTDVSDAAKHVTMVFDQFSHFDMSDTNQVSVLTAILTDIVTAGVIQQADMDTVIAYGDILISRATELEIGTLVLSDVIGART